jgi:serine/threonine protein kinase
MDCQRSSSTPSLNGFHGQIFVPTVSVASASSQESRKSTKTARFLDLFEASTTQELQTKKKHRPIGLTEKRLRLILSEAKRSEAKSKNPTNLLKFRRESFLTISSQTEPLQIFRLPSIPPKATGETATIHDAFHINRGKNITLKIARNDKYPSSHDTLKHETQGLINIHSKLDTKKIQACPYVSFEIKGTFCGFAGKTYTRDLYTLLFEQGKIPHLEIRLLWCYDLAVALAELMTISIVHGDPKLENVFCTEHEGRIKVCLGDFGAHFDLTQIDQIPLTFHSFTYSSCPFADFTLIKQAVEENNRELFAAVRKAHDVYALGCLFHEILTGGRPPYPLSEGLFPDHSAPFDSSFLSNYIQDENFSLLLEGMLHSDYLVRPDIFTIVKSMQPILKEFKCDFEESPLLNRETRDSSLKTFEEDF